MKSAKKGQVIFIPGNIELNLTARIYIEKLKFKIPSGIMIASNRGHNGSNGALIKSNALATPVIFQVIGENTHITGLRIQGPCSETYTAHHQRAFTHADKGRDYYYKLPTSNGIISNFSNTVVSNCEIYGFSHAAIYLKKGVNHKIHGCFIHHCQYQGLGYGISLNRASALIEYNTFNWNRHSIAGTGYPECSYIARYNTVLEESLSHCFDMHGGADRKDGTQIAGSNI